MAQQIQELQDDVVILAKSETITAQAGPVLRATGWRGGTFVMYVPPTGVDEFVVERTDGSNLAGMLLFPSEDYQNLAAGAPENFTAEQVRTAQGAASGASTITVVTDFARCLFRFFETVSLDAGGARVGPPIIYVLNEWLHISENGLLCNDLPARLILAGVATPLNVGTCSSLPAARNGARLGVELRW